MANKKIIDVNLVDSKIYTRNDNLMSYFNSVRKYELLTENEERKLLLMVHNGNDRQKKDARKKLLLCNQRFVIAVAKRYANNSNLLDLIEEANIGLLRAIDAYDIHKGNRLLTYAIYFMVRQINVYIVETSKMIKPKNAYAVYYHIRKAIENFVKENNRQPTDEEIIEYFEEHYGIRINNKDDISKISMKSLDDILPGEDENENTCQDYLLYKHGYASDFDDYTDASDNNTVINKILKSLNEKEKTVILNVFGIGCEKLSYRRIGDKLNMSPENVRAVYNRAIMKLKKYNIKNL